MNNLLKSVRELNLAEKKIWEADNSYVPKQFEICCGEAKEVIDDEVSAVLSNPSSFDSETQIKYFGISMDEYKEPNSYDGEVPDGYEIYDKPHVNPFTKKEIIVKSIRPIEISE